MGTKYTYSEGATYQSESTPITIAKIPTGEYTIKAVSGDLEGEITFEATPGTQRITLTIRTDPYDFSSAYWKDTSVDGSGASFALYGVTVNDASIVAKLVASGSAQCDIGHDYSFELSTTAPNGSYTVVSGNAPGLYVGSVILTAYDADNNVLQTATIPEQ